jgi:hypothetical protein
MNSLHRTARRDFSRAGWMFSVKVVAGAGNHREFSWKINV